MPDVFQASIIRYTARNPLFSAKASNKANAKWAFADERDARKFIARYGGKLTDFEKAISAAFNDMYKDTKMIREKRQRKKHSQ